MRPMKSNSSISVLDNTTQESAQNFLQILVIKNGKLLRSLLGQVGYIQADYL